MLALYKTPPFVFSIETFSIQDHCRLGAIGREHIWSTHARRACHAAIRNTSRTPELITSSVSLNVHTRTHILSRIFAMIKHAYARTRDTVISLFLCISVPRPRCIKPLSVFGPRLSGHPQNAHRQRNEFDTLVCLFIHKCNVDAIVQTHSLTHSLAHRHPPSK